VKEPQAIRMAIRMAKADQKSTLNMLDFPLRSNSPIDSFPYRTFVLVVISIAWVWNKAITFGHP
jgi:hypothetical protein